MGWKNKQYQRSRGNRRTYKPSVPFEGDGLNVFEGKFVFRPHFFDSYRLRVPDPQKEERADQDIAKIVVHSLMESELPDRVKFGQQYQVIVDLHEHDGDSRREFGLFYIPLKRDVFDVESGKICAVTLLHYEERLSLLHNRKMIKF